MKRILITGIDGFFGRNLASQWMNKYDLIGIDLPKLYEDDELPWSNSVNHCDLREHSSNYSELFEGVHTVVHCAARTRIDASWNEYDDYYLTNIAASQRTFAAAQKAGCKKFIYFSSSSVYGNNGQAVQTEDGPLNPSSPYAVSKLAAEWALKVQAQQGVTELIIVRPFTMYGEHMAFGTYSLAIAKFLKAAAKDEPIIIEGTGEQRRDFVCATDAIDALELILEHGHHGDVFNIGTGQSVSIKQLADAVTHKQVKAPDRVGAVTTTCADISKLAALGYKPKVQVLEWLTNTAKEFKINQSTQ